MKTHLIYHRKDADGILSAAITCAALKLTPENSVLYGVDHPEPCPVKELMSGSGRLIHDRVIIVDFSFPAVVMDYAVEKSQVTLYDHHQSALDDLGHLLPSNPHWVIDPTRAACQIVWDELVGTERPWWLELIGWRDLGGPWQPGADPDKSQDAHTLNTALFTCAPLDPYVLSQHLLAGNDGNWQHWFETTTRLSELQNHSAYLIARAYADNGGPTLQFPDWEPIPVALNIHTALISEVCNQLIELTGCKYAAVCNRQEQAPHHWTLSLRARKGVPGVHELAKRYTGGGHPQAAGLTLPTQPLIIWP